MHYLLAGLIAAVLALSWAWLDAEKDETRAIESCNTTQLEVALDAEKQARAVERAEWKRHQAEYLTRLLETSKEIDMATTDYAVTLERLKNANAQLEILRQRPADPANAVVDSDLRLRAYGSHNED